MDACSLPLRLASISAVVCDLPFNNHHRVAGDLTVFYARLFDELRRVLVPGGRAAVLVGSMAPLVAAVAGRWTVVETHPVQLGRLPAFMALLLPCELSAQS